MSNLFAAVHVSLRFARKTTEIPRSYRKILQTAAFSAAAASLHSLRCLKAEHIDARLQHPPRQTKQRDPGSLLRLIFLA